MEKLVTKLFDQNQMPAENFAACQAIVKEGLRLGTNIGEKVNEWINMLFAKISK
jgi:hypothetical protein